MTLRGAAGLQRRLEAIRSAQGQRAMMNNLGIAVANKAIHNAPYKTRTLQKSIKVTRVSDDSVTIEAQAGYATYVERGTRPHIIMARRAKALRFAATARARRLTGTARRGAKFAGDIVFVAPPRVVHHPGTQPHPFMRPAAEDTLRDSGLVTQSIVQRWDSAD